MSKLIQIILLLIVIFPAYSQDTVLNLYKAYGESEPVIIEKEVQGDCWEQSHYLKREDAWHCEAEKISYDPCFIKPYGNKKEAFCAYSPWSKTVIKINLLTKVNNKKHHLLDMSRTYPWAVELSHGEKCQAIEGKMYEGHPVHYQCDNQTILFGPLQRCMMPWTILQHKGNNRVETVSIIEAWF